MNKLMAGLLCLLGAANAQTSRSAIAVDLTSGSIFQAGSPSATVTKELNGATVWSKALGTAAGDEVLSLAVASNGSVFMAGSRAEGGFLGKLNADGSVAANIATKTAAWAVAVDQAGAVYLAGDNFLSKLDAGLQTMYTVDPGGSVRSIAVDGSGAVIAAISVKNETLVALLSADARSWSFRTSLGAAMPASIALDSGFAYVTGSTNSLDLVVKNAAQEHLNGVSDAFVAKVDLNGAIVWSTYLGGRGEDAATSILINIDHTLLVGGYTTSVDFPGLTNLWNGGEDGFLAQLDEDGNVLASQALGDANNNRVSGIAIDRTGAVRIAGVGSGTVAKLAKVTLQPRTPVCTTNPVVTNLNDSGAGSLRDAVAKACAGSTITFGVTGTITLTSRILLNNSVTINGPGSGSLTISGNNATPIFFVGTGNLNPFSGSVGINNVTLANGRAQGGSSLGGGAGAGMGGALFQNGGALAIANVVFSGNQAVGGSTNGNLNSFDGAGWETDAAGASGGNGGDLGGQGGADNNNNGMNGGDGGPGAGGGFGGDATGGTGGFGGGGGSSYSGGTAGNGGFGGGGGFQANFGHGGFGSGAATSSPYQGGPGAGFGGAIFAYTGTLTLSNVSFTNNTVTGGSNGSTTGQGKGGALFIYKNATAFASGVTYSGSVAAQGGVNSTADIDYNGVLNGTQKQCPGVDNVDVCGTVGAFPTRVTVNAGTTPQSAAVNTSFAIALSVTVKDAQSNNPISGFPITFTAPASGASGAFSGPSTVLTDASGVATAPTFTANTVAGSYTAVATVGTIATTFSLTNTPGAASSITASGSSTPQSATVGMAFANPLSVTVEDAYGNLVPPTTVTFTSPTTGASGKFSNNTNTIVVNTTSGVAAANFTANNTAGGYLVTATAGGLSTTFSLTNNPGAPASISANANTTPQSATVNAAFANPLSVTVKDMYGNPVSVVVAVTFTAPSTGASGKFPTNTNMYVANTSSGVASVTFTANTVAGGYLVTATAGQLSTTFSLTNAPGAPASIAANVNTTPQSATVNTAFATALSVTVKDAQSNPVPNVSVSFTAPVTGASGSFSSTSTVSTNAFGIATAPAFTANTTAGGYLVTATAGQLSTTFSLTNTPGAAASILTGAGSTPQTASINTAFANALSVTLKDTYGNLLPTTAVTFTAPPSGASGKFSNNSNTIIVNSASGVASATFTANGTAGGPYQVTAAAGNVSTTFSLTNSLPFVPSMIQLIQQAPGSNIGNNQNTLTVTLAQTPTATNTLVLAFNQVGTQQTITNITGANWTMVAKNQTSSGDEEIWVGTNPTSKTITLTGVTYFGTFQPGYAIVSEFSGISATVDGAPALTTSGIWPVTTGTVNTTNGIDLLVTSALSYNGGGTAATISQPWTLLSAPAGTYSLAAAYQVTSAPGAFKATWNGQGTPQVATIAVAFQGTGSNLSGVTLTSGAPQSTTVTTAFGNMLQALVRDGSNNPVSGVPVTFTAPLTGPSGSFPGPVNTVTVNSDGSGVATSPVFTANTVAGTFNVSATAPGVAAPALFTLTNTAGAAASIQATGGTPQSAAINTAFPAALQATVKDQYGNLVYNQGVVFTAPGSGASASFGGQASTTVATNMQGVATSPTPMANGQQGGYSVTATLAGIPQSPTATFTLNNAAAGVPSGISLVQQGSGANLGNNQNTLTVSLPAMPLATNVVVLVFDQVGTTQTITGISGATWTRAGRNQTNNGDEEIWVGINPTSKTFTVTGTTYFGGFQPGYAIVAEFTGTSANLDGTPTVTTSGIWPVTTAALNTNTPGDLLISAALSYNGGGQSATVNNGWTLFNTVPGTYSLGAAYKISDGPNSYSTTWNGQGTPQVTTLSVALKPQGAI